MLELWTDFVGWMTRDRVWLAAFAAAGFFFAWGVLLVLAVLPWWLRRIEAARWRPMRRRLVAAVLAAHRDCADNVVALSRQLFRENAGAPLERLVRARCALERQRADGERFARTLTIYAPAVDARHADLLAATSALVGSAERTLAGLARLYLKEATVRVAPNVVHGDDYLGYAPGQPVALGHVRELEALADGFVAAAVEHRALIERALGRRERKAHGEELGRIGEDVAMLGADVRRFCARLQPVDADCTTHKSRGAGDRVTRTLDALIARFDRAG